MLDFEHISKIEDFYVRHHILSLKYPDFHLSERGVFSQYVFGEYSYTMLLSFGVNISSIYERHGKLNILGYYRILNEEATITAVIDGVLPSEINVEIDNHYANATKHYSFGKEVFPHSYFHITADISPIFDVEGAAISLFYKTNNDVLIAPQTVSHNWSSRFHFGNTAIICDNVILNVTNAKNTFTVSQLSTKNIAFLMYKPHSKDYVYDNALLYSTVIGNLAILSKKRIWLFMDRFTKCDDNAQALFKYCHNIEDGVEKYYVLPKAEDYNKHFEGLPWKFVIFGSFEFKLLVMFAEKLISSHDLMNFTKLIDYSQEQDVKKVEATYRNFRKIFFQFFHGDFVFLQHGVTKENISSWLNKYKIPVDIFVTTGQVEFKSINDNPDYGFNSGAVILTGLPRHDYLINNPQKIILFMPTFFAPLSDPMSSYNEDYKNHQHCRFINEFLNSERLHTALSDYGYRIVFKMHERLLVQSGDYTIPEVLEVVNEELSYNELFCTSDLLITDYSSVFFDFAYMKKPVLYYHEIPNVKFKDDYFDYTRDGFGEVVYSVDDLVNETIRHIENGCQMSDLYQQRVDDFFMFNDNNNCKRVYEKIAALPVNKREIIK